MRVMRGIETFWFLGNWFFKRLMFLTGVVFVCQVASDAQPQKHRHFIKQDLFSHYSVSKRQQSLTNEAHESKSVWKAVALSLLFPGMGELYAGRFDVGRYMMISESGLWLAYSGFRVYGGLLRDDARDFASVHAQINPAGKGDQFYVDIGNFRDVFEYNEKQLRDREVQRLYDPGAGFFWRWDDDASRRRYRNLRVSSDEVFNNSRFVIGAIVVNHLISALNAARFTVSHNRGVGAGVAIDVRASDLCGVGVPADGVALNITTFF